MHFIIEFSNGIVQLSSVYSICAIKSMIVLEMKCPQYICEAEIAGSNQINQLLWFPPVRECKLLSVSQEIQLY